uniref:Uncharacterized protein n=1 Tax=Aegilops tauschii subsp. strangulata TaxID=200361 RepID=A0A453B6X4_AEGTS
MKPLPVTLALLALFLAASYQDLAVAAAGNFTGHRHSLICSSYHSGMHSLMTRTTYFVCLVVGGHADADADGVGSGAPVLDSVCEGKCKNRCSQKVAGRCMGLCMMCCGKCAGCVPSGPLAPKDECPCYRDMKSPKSGRPKCP